MAEASRGATPDATRNRPEERSTEPTTQYRIIIDQGLWDTVQERRRLTAARYGKGQKPGGAVSPGPRSHHVLSGLLTCGVCGGNMAVSGGSSASLLPLHGRQETRELQQQALSAGRTWRLRGSGPRSGKS